MSCDDGTVLTFTPKNGTRLFPLLVAGVGILLLLPSKQWSPMATGFQGLQRQSKELVGSIDPPNMTPYIVSL